MKHKPIIFNFLFMFFCGIALSLPLQVAFLYEHQITNWYEWQSIFMKLTPLNWCVALITLFNGILCFTANPVIKYTIPISIILVGINNFFVGAWGVDFSLMMTWLATLAYIAVSYSYVYAHGLEAIENPHLQWWKIPRRVKKSYPVWIEYQGHRKLLAKTFDISKSGAFISGISQNPKSIPEDIKIGEDLKLLIGTGDGELVVPAQIVRRENKALGHYPTGVGVRFKSLNILQSLKLKKLLNEQELLIA